MESQSNNIAKTLEYVQQKRGGGKVYIQGLIGVSIFVVSLLVVLLVYVPYLQETQELVKKRQVVEEDVAALQKKYDTISGYNRSDLDDGLKSARYFIPDDMRVAQLASFINVNSKQFNLEVSRLGINEDRAEVKQTSSAEEKDKLIGSAGEAQKVLLGRVEGPFSFRGSRENIYKFLDFLVMGGFATNFDQVTLNSSDNEENWSVSFFTSYYYLNPVTKVEASRPLLEVQKDALKPITVNEDDILPTPVEVSPTPSVSGTPTVSVTPSATTLPSVTTTP